MKKGIILAVLLAFGAVASGPAGAVRGKDKDAKAAAKSKAAVTNAGVQSKANAQAKTGAAQASKGAAAKNATVK